MSLFFNAGKALHKARIISCIVYSLQWSHDPHRGTYVIKIRNIN